MLGEVLSIPGAANEQATQFRGPSCSAWRSRPGTWRSTSPAARRPPPAVTCGHHLSSSCSRSRSASASTRRSSSSRPHRTTSLDGDVPPLARCGVVQDGGVHQLAAHTSRQNLPPSSELAQSSIRSSSSPAMRSLAAHEHLFAEIAATRRDLRLHKAACSSRAPDRSSPALPATATLTEFALSR